MHEAPKSPFLTITEAAQYLRISRSSIYLMFDRGELKKVKVGHRTLVSREALELFARHASGAVAAE